MYSRSSTAAGGTPAAPPSDPRDAHGAPSLQATTKINYGVIVVDKEEVPELFVTCLKSLVLVEQLLEDGISTERQEDARCSLMVAVGEMPTTLEPRVNVNRNV